MEKESFIPEFGENFVVVPVHVAYKEVEDGHVYDVEEPVAGVVGIKLLYGVTVERIHFPFLSSAESIGTYPGVGDGDSGSNAESGQVGRQWALQQVWAPTHRILCLAHVQALGKETRVVRWWSEEDSS